MKNYMTFKNVKVEEMSRIEYVESRGWKLPSDEEHLKDERVFKVYYPDGYTSMFPKKTFLRTAYEISEENKIPNELVEGFIVEKEIKSERILGQLMTVVHAKLRNGMVLVETTSCVDEKNYSEEIGAEICLNNIKNKIWFSLGFMLKCAQ